jgi:uncharacterized protein
MLEIKETKHGVQFKVKVQPRASKNELSGLLDDALKVRLTSPPVEGEANTACIKLFSTLLNTAKSNISIISGETSRNKTLEVRGLSLEQVKQKLEQALN